MKYSNVFNPERLRAARLYEGKTIADLARLTDVSKQAISQYEHGKAVPSLETLMKIISVLKFPREFFYGHDNENIHIGNTFFRSALTANKTARLTQIERMKVLSKIYSFLDEYINFPELNLPNLEVDLEYLDQEQIERLALETREFWGLGEEPIPNMVYLLEKNGVIVSSFETADEKIDAFSQRQVVDGKERYFIVLGNDKKSAVRRQFDSAHEAGHVLIHNCDLNVEELSKDEYKEMERQADQFAASFLLPKNAFLRDLAYPNKLDFYIELKKKWRVSIGAMIIRAYQLQAINYNQYQYLMRQMSAKGMRTREPLDNVMAVSEPTVLRKAIDLLLTSNVLTSKQIIQELALPKEKIEVLLNLDKGMLKEKEAYTEENIVKLSIPNRKNTFAK
ncbi:helix-turn-helix domain-containing protein [Aneurinibacillus sp. UBA3580]|jgi:Zn-dependent peptidase ImmA (M78 family)/DNA-binding XRE family transcriptional regulator|uniref:helix-turn-helix domain-containing protein n=1 Tax=Aneurinibacillus sp. UBA3580 TaxID=1946041 RepID=UPI00257E15F8|nr:XRE family transcriptional regulator [Aneurinibacillus sp. UBA3580]